MERELRVHISNSKDNAAECGLSPYPQFKGPRKGLWDGDPYPQLKQPRSMAWFESPYPKSSGYKTQHGLRVHSADSRGQARECGFTVHISNSRGPNSGAICPNQGATQHSVGSEYISPNPRVRH